MKFVDTVNINIVGGKGGDGAVAFRRELYVPKGGPAGGDGGKGGDVIFIASSNVNTLVELGYRKHIKAEDGHNGQSKNKHGHNGKDTYIEVPIGTIVFDLKNNSVLFDINKDGQKVIVAKGGQGGRGNSRFCNSRNKAPTLFERGDLGINLNIRCELKLLADAGLVGLPNAGKSTLLSKLSDAKPEISDYPFTTLSPKLGVALDANNSSFVVADLPGLIAGASLGKGLGHIFLKHVERCKVIIHVVDISLENIDDIIQNYKIIMKELKDYNLNLLSKKQLIVLNKSDIEISKTNTIIFQKYLKENKINVQTVNISALKNQNLKQLKLAINALVKSTKDTFILEEKPTEYAKHKNYNYKDINKDEELIVEKISDNKWSLKGKAVYKIYHKFPISTHDNLLTFNNNLQKIGAFDILRSKKIKKGDIIKIFDVELEWKE